MSGRLLRHITAVITRAAVFPIGLTTKNKCNVRRHRLWPLPPLRGCPLRLCSTIEKSQRQRSMSSASSKSSCKERVWLHKADKGIRCCFFLGRAQPLFFRWSLDWCLRQEAVLSHRGPGAVRRSQTEHGQTDQQRASSKLRGKHRQRKRGSKPDSPTVTGGKNLQGNALQGVETGKVSFFTSC